MRKIIEIGFLGCGTVVKPYGDIKNNFTYD